MREFAKHLLSPFPDRRSFLRSLLVLNSLAVAIWGFWAVRFSLFSRLDALLHAYPDSASYAAVRDWIYGQGPATAHTLDRTFLYPLLLGIEGIAGGVGLWLLQCLLLLAAVNLLGLTLRRISGRRIAVQAGFLAFALYPTFFFMTFRIMPETAAVFLLCAWLHAFARAREGGWQSDPQVFLPLLLAGLLSAAKPVFLPFFVLLGLAMAAVRIRPRRLLLVALAGLPLLIQVGINVRLHGRAVFSVKGTSAVNNSFLPRLLVEVRHDESHPGQGPSPGFDRSRRDEAGLELRAWPAAKKAAFLRRHWLRAVSLFLRNVLVENMTQGFGEVPQRPFYLGTKAFNIGALLLHFYMLPVILLILFLRIGPWEDRLWLLLQAVLLLLLILATGTVYWQAERYVFIMIPLWITLYAAAFSLLRGRVRLSP